MNPVNTPNKKHIDNVLLLILIFNVIQLPIRWLPVISDPLILVYTQALTMFLFIVFYIGRTFIYNSLSIPFPKVIFSSVLIMMPILVAQDVMMILSILFGIMCMMFFYQNPNYVKYVFIVNAIWISAISLFALLVTYTPISGYDLPGPLRISYVNPLDRWDHPSIRQNTFGFFASRSIYTIISMTFVFTATYSWFSDNIIKSTSYLVMSSVLLVHLYTIYSLTGSGRAGFIIPIFFFFIFALKKFNLEGIIPLLVISPVILWIVIYVLKNLFNIEQYLIYLDDFLSHRLSIYLDILDILTGNSRSLIGWGKAPWGEYSLSELGVHQSLTRYDSMLARPHNFLFEYTIEYGIIFGIVLLNLCVNISKTAVKEIYQPTSSTRFAIVVMILGSIFTGLAVGGKTGPYAVNYPQAALWWISLGGFIGLLSK